MLCRSASWPARLSRKKMDLHSLRPRFWLPEVLQPTSQSQLLSLYYRSGDVCRAAAAGLGCFSFFTLEFVMTESSQPIVVEQAFNHSKETVWKAITEHDQMVKWFFDNIPEFKAEVGFETQFHVQAGERDFHHFWKITEVIPTQKIVYNWRFEDLPGVGTVTFEIFEEGDRSLLRLTNEGLDSFPQDIPEFARESCEGGWKYFIQQNLKNYLEVRE
jgi:uncharacterized protein YndB with AHSA1/START domain